jgi:hypothetical protein
MISNENLSVAIMVVPLWSFAVDCVKDILEALTMKPSLHDKALLHFLDRSREIWYLT